MPKTVEAIFDGEVLRPTESMDIKPHTRVRITVEDIVTEPQKKKSFLQVARELQLDGPSDFSTRLDEYLYGDLGKRKDD
jgi:predicted DNA-binding antitoxin AbrB/MazE fold protein